jgi:hypothetical protein
MHIAQMLKSRYSSTLSKYEITKFTTRSRKEIQRNGDVLMFF